MQFHENIGNGPRKSSLKFGDILDSGEPICGTRKHFLDWFEDNSLSMDVGTITNHHFNVSLSDDPVRKAMVN